MTPLLHHPERKQQKTKKNKKNAPAAQNAVERSWWIYLCVSLSHISGRCVRTSRGSGGFMESITIVTWQTFFLVLLPWQPCRHRTLYLQASTHALYSHGVDSFTHGKIKIYSHRFLLLVDTSASLGSAPPRLFSSFLFLFFSVRNGSNLLPSCAANWSVCVKRPGEGCEGALFNEVWSH